MKEPENSNIVTPVKAMNVIVRAITRVGAAIMSIGTFILFSESIHNLLHEPKSFDYVIEELVHLIFAIPLFWFFSNFAVKGTPPKSWNPYK